MSFNSQRIRRMRRLARDTQVRELERLFVVEGPRLVDGAINANLKIAEVIMHEDEEDHDHEHDHGEDLSSLSVAELKERCKAAGLKVGGKKADLIARLSQEEE